MLVAQFRRAFVNEGGHFQRTAATGVFVIAVAFVFEILRHDGDVIAFFVRTGPGDLEPASRDHRFRCGQRGFARLFHLRFFDFRLDDHLQCVRESRGVVRFQEKPAGRGGEAFDGLGRFVIEIEGDDMSGEIHAARLQKPCRLAGIAVAGFLAVGDEDDGGLRFRGAQFFRGKFHRIGQRGHPLRLDRVDRLFKCLAVEFSGFDEQFDVLAVALAPVPIGDEAEFRVLGQLVHQPGDDLAGDLDFGPAFDLPPHAARGIEHQNRSGRLFRGVEGGRQHGDQQRQKFQAMPHFLLCDVSGVSHSVGDCCFGMILVYGAAASSAQLFQQGPVQADPGFEI